MARADVMRISASLAEGCTDFELIQYKLPSKQESDAHTQDAEDSDLVTTVGCSYGCLVGCLPIMQRDLARLESATAAGQD